MSEPIKCVFCEKVVKGEGVSDSLNNLNLGNGKICCAFCNTEEKLGKMCLKCWFSSFLKKEKEELTKLKEEYQQEKNNFPGYETSEESKKTKANIERNEKNINVWEKQLSEFTCLNGVLCELSASEAKKGGYNFKPCGNCGKFLSLSISLNGGNKNDYKTPDFYTHEQNCQGDNNPQPRERESILSYFKTHNIKSIKLENNKLVIEYNNFQTESKEIKDTESQQIKSYAESLGKNELSLADLEQSSNGSNPPKSNKGLYIGLAVVGVLIVGIVAWLVMRNKNKEE